MHQSLTDLDPHDQRLADPFAFASASRDQDVPILVRSALAAGRAKLAFQPVVLARDQSTIAFYEGLVRVLDEAGRVISAAQFMPVITDTDLGRQIDAMTLRLAFAMLRKNSTMRLSINVSARSFGDGRWRKELEAGLGQKGALGDRLIFEISETSVTQLNEVVAHFMEEMQPRGVAFALDGFGGHLTSFQTLRDSFFDLVKVEKSFVKDIATNPDNQMLVDALVTVASKFGMFAVGEGVENQQDAAFLRNLGVDCLQGYHIGPPRFASQ